MITDRDIPMRPEFSDATTSLLKGLLKRNVSAQNKLESNRWKYCSHAKDLDLAVLMTLSDTFSSMGWTGLLFTNGEFRLLSSLKLRMTSTSEISTRCSQKSNLPKLLK